LEKKRLEQKSVFASGATHRARLLDLAADAELADDHPGIEKAGRSTIELPDRDHIIYTFDRGQQVRAIMLPGAPCAGWRPEAWCRRRGWGVARRAAVGCPESDAP